MRLAAILVGLAACGRIGFDPIGGGGDDGTGADANVGAAGESCASPGVLAIGESLSGQSVAGATDDVTPAGCPDGVDVVYAVNSSADVMVRFVIDADFGGTLVTARMCPPIGVGCTGFTASSPQNSGTNLTTGTNYVIVEKTSGTGTTFSISMSTL